MPAPLTAGFVDGIEMQRSRQATEHSTRARATGRRRAAQLSRALVDGISRVIDAMSFHNVEIATLHDPDELIVECTRRDDPRHGRAVPQPLRLPRLAAGRSLSAQPSIGASGTDASGRAV